MKVILECMINFWYKIFCVSVCWTLVIFYCANRKQSLAHFPNIGFLNNSSVKMQKGEYRNGCSKKTKHAMFFKK